MKAHAKFGDIVSELLTTLEAERGIVRLAVSTQLNHALVS